MMNAARFCLIFAIIFMTAYLIGGALLLELFGAPKSSLFPVAWGLASFLIASVGAHEAIWG